MAINRDGVPVSPLAYSYDLLNRVTIRNTDAFGYNLRSEVTSATIQPSHTNCYEYDNIGNNLWTSLNAATNTYAANALNQYTGISNGSVIEPEYDLDGNMTWDGRFSYTWDAENRLVAAYSNSVCVVSNAYDHQSRRILKVTPTATHTFLYDGWNLIAEVLSPASGVPSTNHFVWGRDLSGSFQGAGGVGGLLAVQMSGAWYFPFYDNNGNIVAYVDESGELVAEYTYDAFGSTIVATGPLADVFHHRFSTKYFDKEVGLYYYGYRFYDPVLHRWCNRDPIEEDGGLNLYAYLKNSPVFLIDELGLRTYSFGSEIEPHVQFDEDLLHNPNEKATLSDWSSWNSWGIKLELAEKQGMMPDAVRLYRHYRSGQGTDMRIDYEGACRSDFGVYLSVQDALSEAQREAERLAAGNTDGYFGMVSDIGWASHYPQTENWQKAIGAHIIWGYADVRVCGGNFSMTIRLHELDRYNFNKGAKDIATGTSDDINGRFAVLGWARSFITRGTLSRRVTWSKNVPGSTIVSFK